LRHVAWISVLECQFSAERGPTTPTRKAMVISSWLGTGLFRNNGVVSFANMLAASRNKARV
jgi:hypothetical protein